jgi:hypothetical protein
MDWCSIGWQIVFTICFLAAMFVVFASVNVIWGDGNDYEGGM